MKQDGQINEGSKNYYTLCLTNSICLSYFDLTQFKKAKKTFESCDLRLKICQMFQNALKSFSLKYIMWKVEIKQLSEKERGILFEMD